MTRNANDKIDVMVLTELRCMKVRGNPDEVVLQLTSGKCVKHYSLTVADLAGVAERLRRDALLLNGDNTSALQ